jgi:hypothetical protein
LIRKETLLKKIQLKKEYIFEKLEQFLGEVNFWIFGDKSKERD